MKMEKKEGGGQKSATFSILLIPSDCSLKDTLWEQSIRDKIGTEMSLNNVDSGDMGQNPGKSFTDRIK